MAKWIDDVRPAQPVSELARRALDLRLSSVWHHLPLAAQLAADDVEHVHLLRVATRRAAATLRLFKDLLPRRRRRWLTKQLRRIRRAAGEARDFDVLEARLPHWAGDNESDEIQDELKKVHDCRVSAQGPIVEVHRRLRRKGFPERAAALVSRTRWRTDEAPEPTVTLAAQHRLRPFVDEFFAAAQAPAFDAETLHRLRILGKRLRYAMEIFAGAFDPSFREQLYPQIEEVQERLGDISDRANAIERFEAWSADRHSRRRQERLRHLLTLQQASFAECRQEFLAWWTPRRVAELAEQFSLVLAPSGELSAEAHEPVAASTALPHDAAAYNGANGSAAETPTTDFAPADQPANS